MTVYVALDLETTRILPGETPRIHCVGLVGGVYDNVYPWGTAIASTIAYELFVGTVFVIHNAAFDVSVLRHHGVTIPPTQYVCTMVALHAINPQLGGYSLSDYGRSVGDEKIDYRQALISAGLWGADRHRDDVGFYDIPFNPHMERYCLQDTRLALQLWGECESHFAADAKLSHYYHTIALPFVEVVISMRGGLHVDRQRMLTLASELVAEAAAKQDAFAVDYPQCIAIKWDDEAKLYRPKVPTSAHPVNLSSPYDVVSLLMSHGWVPDDFSKTGRPVTSQNTLKRLIATPETPPTLKALAERLTEVRSLIGLTQQAVQFLTLAKSNGIVYGNWHQTGTKTARLSSSNPNMQNVSTRHPKWGSRMRECFTPPTGYTMLCGDLSQIELGILAYYLELVCGDSAMADGNRAGKDAHDTNTETWYGIEKGAEGFKAKRAQAKNGIFAAGYGAKAKRLSLTLNISLSEAQEILNVVDTSTDIDKLKRYMWGQMRQHRDVKPLSVPRSFERTTQGIFYDVMGSRGFYPNIAHRERYERSSAERQAFNALCQRGCASILYSLLNQCQPDVTKCGGWFAGVVHDEALIYVPTESASAVLETCNRVFNSLVLPTKQGGVYVRADFHIVNSWADK